MSPQQGYRLNPFHMGMGLLAGAQGGQMLDAKTNNKYVYGFGASKDGRVLLYLINKTEEKQNLAISLSGVPFKCLGGKVMQDTPDHWGELVDLPVRTGKTFEATLPPLSFCRIVFEPEPNAPDAGKEASRRLGTQENSGCFRCRPHGASPLVRFVTSLVTGNRHVCGCGSHTRRKYASLRQDPRWDRILHSDGVFFFKEIDDVIRNSAGPC